MSYDNEHNTNPEHDLTIEPRPNTPEQGILRQGNSNSDENVLNHIRDIHKDNNEEAKGDNLEVNRGRFEEEEELIFNNCLLFPYSSDFLLKRSIAWLMEKIITLTKIIENLANKKMKEDEDKHKESYVNSKENEEEKKNSDENDGKQSLEKEDSSKRLYLPWLEPIVRRDKDFENAGKPRFESSNSLSCGIFKEVATNKEWLGKSLTSNREQSEAWAIKERIAADMYAYYGVEVPKIEMSLQKMTNVIEFPALEGKESIHVMSELIEGFKTYKEAFAEKFKIINPNPDQQIILPKGERIPEKGLGKILAVATLINDIDVIGANGGNIGFQIVSHPTKGRYAQTIKIDPGEAFTINEVSNPRKIRVAFTGTPKETELNFDDLPNGTKKEFLATIHKISETTEATFRGFFTREGAHHFATYYNRTIDELTKFLMDRKAEILGDYQKYLDEAQILYHEEQESIEVKKNTEEQARVDERQAYQEELYYYIDPYVLFQEKAEEQIALTTAINFFLNFDEENNAKVMLIKGESGAGKSLALRFIEQRLLEGRRQCKDLPIPIHIDLKRFNKDNVGESFERTLKEKYHKEHNPNKSHLVLLMDGYDEISGGCHLNLYEKQQLNRYSKNLRVIITCRTQYLTSGYQQSFKPAESDLRELEIQPFNDYQIDEYLKKYSHESGKVDKPSYSLVGYQEKLREYPALKDLIVNPFMLRLIAESLPRIDDRLKLTKSEIEMKKTGEEKASVVINKYAVYECFMEHWFAKQELRLKQSSGIIEGDQAMKAFRDFSNEVALLLLSKREVEIRIKEDQLWEIYFGDTNPDIVKARNGCPLRRQNDHIYTFIHKSFLEYFAASSILEIVANKNQRLAKIIQLSPEMVTQDKGVISFFRDAFILKPELKDICLNRIEESKSIGSKTKSDLNNHMIVTRASNAVTLLNIIGYDFSNQDLSNISIPHANLSHGTFEQTNFANADLANVNFASAWLKDANFREADLTGVNFGEWPYLEFDEPIRCISFSEKGGTIAAVMGNSIIIFERCINTKKVRELKRIRGKSDKSIEYCKLKHDGNQVIVCCKDSIPRILDIATEICIFEFQKGFGYESTTFDLSPDEKQVVTPSEDNSLRIWNLVTKDFTHEFRGHTGSITCCKFSPDGSQVISASEDKTLRIWDVFSGLFAQQTMKSDSLKKGLNLFGADIEDVVGLSDTNLMLLYQREACGFHEKERERFINNLKDLVGEQSQDSLKLDLSLKSIGNQGAWGIGRYTAWNSLEELNLSRNAIGDNGASGLGKNVTWKKLKSLNLAMNVIEDEGAKGLTKNSSWCNLEELDLRSNKIGDVGAQALSTNSEWKRLKNIHLKDNKLNQVSVVMRFLNEKYSKQLINIKTHNSLEFEEAEHKKKIIRKLHQEFINEVSQFKDERKAVFADILKTRDTFKINQEDFCREGFLAGNDDEDLSLIWMPYVKSFDLSSEKIKKKTIIFLARNLSVIDVEELILPANEIGNEDLGIIFENFPGKNFKKISIQNNGLNDNDVGILMNSLKSWELEELNLSKNKINDLGADRILSSKALRSLKKLSLEDNKISFDGVAALIENSLSENLEVLNLSVNDIGDKGAITIGINAIWKNLKELYLSKCGIGIEGGFALAKNLIWNNLRVLNLSNNRIGVKSVMALSTKDIDTYNNLEILDLSNNQIDDEGVF